nr:exonuclease SbcCD subunit D [Methylomarinum sp. Ch1-1]MDP4520882.1 exonuclease SbcCD subunit D C-terminal domain-containing protein [Methylomarinum sp. Ch1-1]
MHEFVGGAEESDSERQLTVGGASQIDAGILRDFDYVAMGHLHRPQATGGDHIRYSGSLLKYSFSEVHHHKGVTEVVLDGDGFAECLSVPLQPLRNMRIVRGRLEEIVQQARLDACSDDYICAELLDEGALYEPMRRLQEVYPNTLEIKYVVQSSPQGISGDKSFHELHKQDVTELFDEFYRHVCAEPLNDPQRQFVKTIVEQLEQTDH